MAAHRKKGKAPEPKRWPIFVSHAGTGRIVDFDGDVSQASKLGRSQKDDEQNGQGKSQFDESAPVVFAGESAKAAEREQTSAALDV